MQKKIATLILAAGAGSRMGAIKQLLLWKKTTLLGNAIELAKSITGSGTFVVIGANARKVALEVVRNKAIPITNNKWEQGMGTSIATGVKVIIETGGFDGILVMLADQPFLTVPHLKEITNLFEENDQAIIASTYINLKKSIVPILFDAVYYKDLTSLEGAQGAKMILDKYKESVIQVFVNSEFKDVDSPSDYKRYKAEESSK
jgi:molybdenum cofactor cytidylyltransferase